LSWINKQKQPRNGLRKEQEMAIITISRGSYFRGKEVAEKLAEKLGYRCISRDILLEASEEFNIPEIKLIRAIQDAPSILNRLTRQKEKYVAYIRAALLKHVQKDNVVYHGLFGHFFLQDIPHVLKVRIVADLEARVADEVKREGISATKARFRPAKKTYPSGKDLFSLLCSVMRSVAQPI